MKAKARKGTQVKRASTPTDENYDNTEKALFKLTDALSKAIWWLERTESDFVPEYRQILGTTCTRAHMMREVRKMREEDGGKSPTGRLETRSPALQNLPDSPAAKLEREL